MRTKKHRLRACLYLCALERLCVRVFSCVYVYVCVCVCVCIHVRVCALYMCMRIFVCVHVYVCGVDVCVCARFCVYVCARARAYACGRGLTHACSYFKLLYIHDHACPHIQHLFDDVGEVPVVASQICVFACVCTYACNSYEMRTWFQACPQCSGPLFLGNSGNGAEQAAAMVGCDVENQPSR